MDSCCWSTFAVDVDEKSESGKRKKMGESVRNNKPK
jgi:hypothetical protein